MKMWMKVLVWLGLGGGIGFFAGYGIGYSKGQKDTMNEADRMVDEAEKKAWLLMQKPNMKKEDEAIDVHVVHPDMNDISEMMGKYFPQDEDKEEEDEDENFDIPDDDELFEADTDDEEEESGEDTDEDEIPQFHPEDIRPVPVTEDEYNRNEKDYDLVELDYYFGDDVLFDPGREEIWTNGYQLLGIGWSTIFGKNKPEIWIRNDTMETYYKITRHNENFHDLYDEEDEEEEE